MSDRIYSLVLAASIIAGFFVLLAFGQFAIDVFTVEPNTRVQALGNVVGAIIGAAGAALGVFWTLRTDQRRRAKTTAQIRTLLLEELARTAFRMRLQLDAAEFMQQNATTEFNDRETMKRLEIGDVPMWKQYTNQLHELDASEAELMRLLYDNLEYHHEKLKDIREEVSAFGGNVVGYASKGISSLRVLVLSWERLLALAPACFADVAGALGSRDGRQT